MSGRGHRPQISWIYYDAHHLGGFLFVCAIAIMPDAIMASFKVPYLVVSFFGGTVF